MATNKATNKMPSVFKRVGLKVGAQRRATEAGKRHAATKAYKNLDVPPGMSTYNSAKGSFERSRANDLQTAYMAGFTS